MRFSLFLSPAMHIRSLLALSLCCMLMVSCGSYDKVLKSNDINYKLTKANEFYDKKQYQKANELYRNLLPVLKGTRNYEALYSKYAWSFYQQKDYLSASYHFKNFIDFFPNSKDAEEMEFMYAVSLYKLSPKPSLEQTNTIKAMEALQQFINSHPASARVAEASQYIENGRKKLETKDANAAQLYFNIAQYKAAVQSYKSLLLNYPDSDNSDLYQYMIVRSMYSYAKASITERQQERYGDVVAAYQELKETYPKSKYLRDAEKLFSQADNSIKKLRNEQS